MTNGGSNSDSQTQFWSFSQYFSSGPCSDFWISGFQIRGTSGTKCSKFLLRNLQLCSFYISCSSFNCRAVGRCKFGYNLKESLAFVRHIVAIWIQEWLELWYHHVHSCLKPTKKSVKSRCMLNSTSLQARPAEMNLVHASSVRSVSLEVSVQETNLSLLDCPVNNTNVQRNVT